MVVPLLSIMFSPLTILCVSLAPSAAGEKDQIPPTQIALALCQSQIIFSLFPVLLLFLLIEQCAVVNEFVCSVLW